MQKRPLLAFSRKARSFAILVFVLLFTLDVSAHRVEYYTSNGCTTGQNITIDALITNAPAVTWYNWQYKDAGGTWKCFVDGSNTINGVAFTVSGSASQNVANDAPLLTIQSATAALEDVQIRVLMRENGSPCGAPAGTVWGGDDLAPYEVKVYRIHVYSNAADCGGTTPGCIGNVLTNGSGYYGGFENKVYNASTATFTDNNFIAGTASSQYTVAGGTSSIPTTSGTGTYQVWNNPYSMNTGNGKFAPHTGNYQMIVQGSANTTRKVWYKTVTVNPGATYSFCAWVARTQGSNVFSMRLTVNGTAVNTTAVPATVGQWTQLCGTYAVPYGVTSLEIAITDVATAAERYFSLDDICFTQTASPVNLGNIIWDDKNDNGIKDSNENGYDGVKVVLYADNNNDGIADGAAIANTTTSGGGIYAFSGLPPGNYFIQLEAYPGTDFYVSHTNGGDPDNNIDNDNNGLSQDLSTTYIKGGTITLQPGTEPTTDGDGNNGNLTYDVGIYKGNGLGDFVWIDSDRNGVQNAGEPGLANVTVNLVNATTNAVVASTVSGSDGYYFFNDFDASQTYKLVFVTPAGYYPTLANTVLNGGNDNNDSDPVGGIITGITVPYGQWNHSYDAGFYPGVNISGNVYNDANGLSGTPANTVDGTGTNAGGLNAVLVNTTTGKVVAVVAVPANGVYTFTGVDVGPYNVLITTNAATVGATPPAVALPANWVSTGENLGAGAGNDGSVNGILPLGTITGSTTNANFGIERKPTANTVTATSQTNPGGTNRVTVPTLNGTDPEDGTYNGTSGTNTIIINTIPTNGVLYYNGTAVTAGQVINNYNPALLTLDPNDGAITVTFTYSEVDAAGVPSSPATVSMPFGTIGISGNVYNDANGLLGTPANTVDGTGTNAGGLNAVLIDAATGKVVASTTVAANGTYSFTGVNGGNYNIEITTNAATVGAAAPAVVLPTNWVSTGENLGAAAGNDGTVNGILPIGTVSASTTNANFGIERKPTANAVTATSQTNPGGTNRVTVPTLNGTDPEDGTYNGTSGTNTIVINTIPTNGVLYYNGTAVTAGQTITNYNPVLLTLDPNDGAITVTFTYSEVDAAGKSSSPATVTMPFGTIGISGNVYNDGNGLIGTPGNTVDGTGTNAGGLNAVLIDAATGKVVASTVVATNGTYSFTGLNGGNYNVAITTNTATLGAAAPAVALPAGWVSTGENLGAAAGNDGTVNGILPIGSISASTTNANFGIERLPTPIGNTLTTQANPGGTVQVSVPAAYFKGTDPEDEIVSNQLHFTSFPSNVTSIVINGVKYMNTATPPAGFVTWPAAGVTVPVGATVTIDPLDGAVVAVIPYNVIDNAGKESTTPANINVPFSASSGPTIPDLTPVILLTVNNMDVNDTRDFVVSLNELLNATTTAQIAFNISVPSGYTLSFSGTQTTSDVLLDNVYTVSNTNWNSFVNSATDIDMQSKTGFAISARGTTKIGFKIKRTTALSNSTGNIIVSIYADPSFKYDSNTANNIYTRVVTAN